mmetsp:Transcript_34245/g.61782  ORF Transcript_34245/g.61782 Transcript_34245/m.61782 type:complete len:81 (+) Transcript_34245:2245-2487(+)
MEESEAVPGEEEAKYGTNTGLETHDVTGTVESELLSLTKDSHANNNHDSVDEVAHTLTGESENDFTTTKSPETFALLSAF